MRALKPGASKEQARKDDEARLAAGEVTRDELRRENSIIPRESIRGYRLLGRRTKAPA